MFKNKDKKIIVNKKKDEKHVKKGIEQAVNVFQDMKRRNSILLQLFDKNGEVMNHCAVAPSPSKDYCQLLITFDRITYRWWRVTHRHDAEKFHPGEIKDTFEDFIDDDNIHHHILCAFGTNFLNYIKNMVIHGKVDYLARLPEPILIKIISYLSLEDISKLSQVNTAFRELCRSDRVWMLLYQKYYTKEITKELYSLAQKKGWRSIFFTNKIKLQVELRREVVADDSNQFGSTIDNSRGDSIMANSSKNSLLRRHSLGGNTKKKSIDDDEIRSTVGVASAFFRTEYNE